MSVLRQTDPAWAPVRLGYGPATIGEAGCLLTTFAQVARHYGLSTNPLDLNRTFINAGRFVGGDLLADDALNGIIPNVHYVNHWDFSNRPADLSVLTNNLTDEYIIELDFDHNPNDGIQTHFVRFVSWDGHNLIIDDPEFGTEENFADHYGTNLGQTILKVIKYVGPAQTFTAPVSAPSIQSYIPKTLLLHAAPAGARVHVAPDVNAALRHNPSVPNGLLNGGQQFNVIGYQTGDDGQIWYVTISHNYVRQDATREGLTAIGGAGGTETEALSDKEPTGQAEGPVEIKKEAASTIEVARTPIVNGSGEPVTVQLEVKASPEVQLHYDELGSLVYDLSQHPVEATEIVPAGTVLPFVAYLTIGDKNYFQTQHIIDEGLDIGIDGLDLKYPDEPEHSEPEAEVEPETNDFKSPRLKKAVSFLDHLSGNKNKGGQ